MDSEEHFFINFIYMLNVAWKQNIQNIYKNWSNRTRCS